MTPTSPTRGGSAARTDGASRGNDAASPVDTTAPRDPAGAPSAAQRRMARRAVVSGTVGSALEWFDFAIYGALSATLFPILFFSDLGPAGGLIASFATFGVGFVARPLGGLVCGYLGDRYGRRPVLLGTFVSMGLASVLIGLLPTGQGAGIAFILVALRFIQGFSLGGEATGAQLMTMEHTVGNRRGIMGSFMIIGSPLSQVLANATLAILAATLTVEQFQGWGWRIPFLLSIALVLVGVFIRLRLDETPAFLEARAEAPAAARRAGGIAVLASQPGTVLTLVLAWAAPVMTFYVVAVYGLSYLTGAAGFAQGDAFLILMVANAVSVLFGIFGGWTSDRIGRRPVLFIGYALCLVGVALFFPAANTGSLPLILAVVMLTLCAVQFQFGAQPALFAEQFPTSTRFTGSALALTLSGLIFAAPAPMLAAWFAGSGGYWYIAVVNLAVIVVSAIALLFVRENRHVDLASFTTLR